MKGIIKYKGYTFWHRVDIVENKIWDFLQENFPDSIIFPEFLGADFVILGKNIPVEIQSTILSINKKGNGEERTAIAHSLFERMIQKQIKQDVEYFGMCWLFFDSEYFRYLQSKLTTKVRINLDWLYQYIKECKIKAFTVSHDGIITEIYYKDFDFLSNISTTCKISRNEDFRIIDRNKFKIISNVLRGYRFTSDELFIFYKNFSKDNGKVFIAWLRREGSSDRECLFGNILHIAGNLMFINQILNRTCNDVKLTTWSKHLLVILGLFEVEGMYRWATSSFIDKFDIANYFPGYVRNKNIWDHLKTERITFSTFKCIATKDGDTRVQIVMKILPEIRMLINQSKNNRVILKSSDVIKELCLDYTKDVENGIYIGLKTALSMEQITVKTAVHKSGENLLIITKKKAI